MLSQGYMISFEGISGAGKTTVIDRFKTHVQNTDNKEVVVKSDLLMYQGEDIGKDIKDLLNKYRGNDAYFQFGLPGVETCLILAKRAFESQTRLLPKLRQGSIVLADRDIDTVCAFQLVAWDNSADRPDNAAFIEAIRAVNAVSLVVPSLTFYFDVSIDAAKGRVEKRDQTKIIERDKLTWEKAKAFYDLALKIPLPGRDVIRIDTTALEIDGVVDSVIKNHQDWKEKRANCG